MRAAKVFAVACSSPDDAGRTLPLHVAGPLSSLDRERMAPGATPESVIAVPIRTLDSVLEEAGAPKLIFYSCGVVTWVKCLIFQGPRVGFRQNVVPRRSDYYLISVAYTAIMC